MRDPLSKADRFEISNSVRNQFSRRMEKTDFVACKSPHLWSREQSECTEYIRFKRTSNFSEWPHFKVNFGFTPKFAADIDLILEDLLKTNQPMYEIWAHHVIPLSEHYRLNTTGHYSSAKPGTWEFRNLYEVDKKIKKIDAFISNYFPEFISYRMNDKFIASVGLKIVDELPPSFKLLQIISCGELGDISAMEDIISYYKNNKFSGKGLRFKKPIVKYGNSLVQHFIN